MGSNGLYFIFFCTLISLTLSSPFPLHHKELKAAASDQDDQWVWSTNHRNGHRLRFEDDDFDDDDDDEDDDHDHHEHCHHHHHHHGHHHGPKFHHHGHHPHHGAVKTWRHHPETYPPSLTPFNKNSPEQKLSESQPTPNKQAIDRNPAPVFEEPEEDDRLTKDSGVPLSPFTSTTLRTTITPEKPVYENIDLRFGA